MLKHIEIYFIEVVTGKRKGMISSILKGLLLLLSWLYKLGVACRNWAFDHGWARKYTPPIPVVISIGNIVAGGTGKTPVTLMIAQEFYDKCPLAILSRGYRSQAEKLSTPVVLSRGQGPMHPATYCGDEPFMLSQNLPNAFVFVGKDRHKASNMAAKAGVQLILLDDGMQHRSLSRDFEIVVMDAYDPFGQGYFLPRGLLREGMRSLSRADLIILNHVHDHQRFIATRQKIARYTTAPVVGTRTEVSQIFDLQDKPVDSIKGKKAGIFCGIAHPDYFCKTVREEGAEIVGQLVVADHGDYDPEKLVDYAQFCLKKGADILICTEKDRVKLVESLELPLPVVWVKMKLTFVEGQTLWHAFIDRAKADLARRM